MDVIAMWGCGALMLLLIILLLSGSIHKLEDKIWPPEVEYIPDATDADYIQAQKELDEEFPGNRPVAEVPAETTYLHFTSRIIPREETLLKRWTHHG